MVGQRLEGRDALCAHLVAHERPGQLASARSPPADQVDEGAQLVLDVGHDAHRRAARPARAAEGDQSPRTRVDPGPRRRAQRKGPVLEEPQRREQAAEAHPRAGDRDDVSRAALQGDDRERVGPSRLAGAQPQRVVGSVVDGVAAHERKTLADGHLGGAKLQPQHRRQGRGQRAPGEQRLLELTVGAREALAGELEVGRLAEDPAQERAQDGVDALGRLGWNAPLAAQAKVALEPSQSLEGLGGGLEGLKAAQHPDLRADELRRAGSVGVERRPRAPGLGQVKGDLSAAGEL